MDYIPALELAAAVAGVFILAGTIRGLRAGEVHFLVQWLFEGGFTRDDARFKPVVVANFVIAGTLFAIAAARLIAFL